MKNIESLTRTPPISRFHLLHHPLDVLKKSINPANTNPKQLEDAASLSLINTLPVDLAVLGFLAGFSTKLKTFNQRIRRGILCAFVGGFTGTTALSLLVNPGITQAVIEDAGVFNSDTGGQSNFGDPNQFKATPDKEDGNQVKLTAKQQRIDQLLNVNRVKDELKDTIDKSNNARASFSFGINNALKNPPDFNNISEFKIVIYDITTGKTYEGNWSDFHLNVAMKSMVRQNIEFYMSCSSFRLKQAPDINILSIDSYRGFEFLKEDLINLQNQGYQVMGPGFNWLVLDPIAPNGYIEVPSALIR